ncbi:hypothetical protein GCM10010425_59820 [Streptomyces spororaveus]|uniref:Uncharacterized protein n=1 Tax=Streptomyces spororaveus TaxID=284039 RepID=A0ABQ3T6Y9_9ACTN|nr:hypothetical protein Sspor_17080 [Streptomyces spororaveus]
MPPSAAPITCFLPGLAGAGPGRKLRAAEQDLPGACTGYYVQAVRLMTISGPPGVENVSPVTVGGVAPRSPDSH